MMNTFDLVLIPEAVHEEILRGLESNSIDVPVIQKAITEKWIRVKKVTKMVSQLPHNLGKGEREAISLMQSEKADWLLVDDELASKTARLLGLNVRSSGYLLIYWTKKGVIKESKALTLLDELVESGYRLSAKHYITIKQLITNIS